MSTCQSCSGESSLTQNTTTFENYTEKTKNHTRFFYGGVIVLSFILLCMFLFFPRKTKKRKRSR